MPTLKAVRKARKLTQIALAQKVGCSPTTICTIERGWGCLQETLDDICQVLGIEPASLTGINVRHKVGKTGWSGQEKIEPNANLAEETTYGPKP